MRPTFNTCKTASTNLAAWYGMAEPNSIVVALRSAEHITPSPNQHNKSQTTNFSGMPPNLHDCFPPPPRITICLHAHTAIEVGQQSGGRLNFICVSASSVHNLIPSGLIIIILVVPPCLFQAEAKSIQLCVCVGFPDPPPACIPTSPPTTTTQCFPPLCPPRRPPVKLDPSISLTNSDKRASATRGDDLGTYACGA